MASPKATIKVEVDEKGAVAGLKNLVSKFKEASTSINQTLEVVTKAYNFVTGAIGKAIDMTAKHVDAAEVAEAAEVRLNTALKIRGQYTAVTAAALKAYAGEIQRSTVVDDEATAGVQAKLLALGVSRDRLNEATKATIGLSEVTGSLEGATVTVAKTLQGNITGLKRLGIQAKDTEEAMSKFTAFFALAEERAKTFGGRLKQLANDQGDLDETLGNIIVKNESWKDTISKLDSNVRDLNRILSEHKSILDDVSTKTAQSVGFFSDLATISGHLYEQYLKGNEATEKALELQKQRTGYAPGEVHWYSLLTEAITLHAKQLRQDNAEMEKSVRLAALIKGAMVVATEDVKTLDLAGKKTTAHSIAKGFGVGKRGTRTGKPVKKGKATNLDKELSLTAEGILNDAGIDEEVEQEKAEKMVAARWRALDIADKQRALQLEHESDAHARSTQALIDSQARQLQATNDFYADMSGVAASGIGAFVGTIVAGIDAGNLSVGAVLGALFGTILSGVGQSMVALGSAALTAATATSGIPLLWPIFGGPIGVAGSLGLIAAGSALIATGGIVGGLAHGGGGSASATRTSAGGGFSARSPSRSQLPGGFTPSNNGGAPAPVIYNLNFNGPMGGSDRRVARDLWRRLNDGRTLSPA